MILYIYELLLYFYNEGVIIFNLLKGENEI